MPWVKPIVLFLFESPKVRAYCPTCVDRYEIDTTTAVAAVRADEPPHNADPCDGCGEQPKLDVPTVWEESRR